MFKRSWIRITALVLAVVLLCTAIFAATDNSALDLSGDGKVNVWDMQVAVNTGAGDKAAILRDILGGGDELHPNEGNVYEIWSLFGLYNMVKNADKGYSFKLMADIDLEGVDWTPVDNFNGEFYGNNKTISNVKITKNTNATDANMGFFGQVTGEGKVENLNLKNVQITATATANYMGLVAGTNAGKITNVTATGIITDARTAKPETCQDPLCYGALVGRCIGDKGSLAGGNSLSVTDSAGKYTTSGLCADFKLVTSVASSEDKFDKGLAGWVEEGFSVSGRYCDSSNSTTLLTATEQSNRQTVVDRMYQMGTVKWTPSETVTFTRHDGILPDYSHLHSNVYVAGETYTGIPYVPAHNGSYERFLSQMQAETDSHDRYVTVAGLQNGLRRNDQVSGMSLYMGNNCSYAVQWAWGAISPTRVYNDANNKAGSVHGGARVYSAQGVVPTNENQLETGVLPVGNYQVPVDGYEDPQMDLRDTASLIGYNGVQTMAEAYAQTHMGDAITFADYYKETAGTYEYDTAHIRMVAADPVIIRENDGEIDLNASYVVTHEQGDGLYDNKTPDGKAYSKAVDYYKTYEKKLTSWRINHRYTLSVLLTQDGFNNAMDGYNKDCAEKKHDNNNSKHPGTGWGYVPVTMRAFAQSSAKELYYTGENITLPDSGEFYSNYWIDSATMTIAENSDGTGQVYNETVFATNRYGDKRNRISLSTDFRDVAGYAGLLEGETYYMTISFLASNGETKYLVEPPAQGSGTTKWKISNKPVQLQFVYNAPTE